MAKEKQRKALELRKAGATYAAIAEQVGYDNAANARRAVLTAMEEVIQEPAVELRTIQVERLNHMLMLVWGQVNKSNGTDGQAIDRALRIMAQLDSLMGTVAAQEVTHKHEGVIVFEGSKDDYIAAMQQMSGVEEAELARIAELEAGKADGSIIEGEVVSDTAEPAMSYVESEERESPAFPVIELDED